MYAADLVTIFGLIKKYNSVSFKVRCVPPKTSTFLFGISQKLTDLVIFGTLNREKI